MCSHERPDHPDRVLPDHRPVIWLVRLLPLRAPIPLILQVLVVLLAIVWLLDRFGGLHRLT